MVGLLGSLSFAVLTSLGANIVVPLSFTPVPITMQTFFVLASGIVLGRKFGVLSQVLYLVFGALGYLQFAGGSVGLSTLFGATGGYLFGFVIAAYLMGLFSDSSSTREPVRIFQSMLLATLIVYSTGIIGLMLVLKIDLFNAMLLGFFPFIPGDMVKIAFLMGLQYFILPSGKTSVDRDTNLLPFISIAISIITFSAFVAYLFTNGNLPPEHLPSISLLLASLILTTVYVNARK